MSKEKKNEEAIKQAEAQATEKRDAEGQAVYHVYCNECGWTGYYHDYNCHCPKTGCRGWLKKL